MLDQALRHIRYAMVLRACASRAGAAERRLLSVLADLHEARGRKVLGAVTSPRASAAPSPTARPGTRVWHANRR